MVTSMEGIFRAYAGMSNIKWCKRIIITGNSRISSKKLIGMSKAASKINWWQPNIDEQFVLRITRHYKATK